MDIIFLVCVCFTKYLVDLICGMTVDWVKMFTLEAEASKLKSSKSCSTFIFFNLNHAVLASISVKLGYLQLVLRENQNH